jgi:hypothetical protein
LTAALQICIDSSERWPTLQICIDSCASDLY